MERPELKASGESSDACACNDVGGAAIITSLDTGLLAMMLGAIIASIATPRNLTFVKLPTGLTDLVLFEASSKEMQKRKEAEAKQLFHAIQQEQQAMQAQKKGRKCSAAPDR